MKRLSCLLLLIACVTSTGCVKYRITLTSGDSFTVLRKPKYDEKLGVYRYKVGGEEQTMSRGRVVSITPASEKEEGSFQSFGK